MKTVWLELKERILEVEEIKVVDLFRNQFEQSEKNHPMDYPAVLLQFDNMTFDDYPAGVQLCNCTLNLFLACEKYADFGNYSEDEEEALKIFDLHDKVYAKLQGFAGASANTVIAAPLRRLVEIQDTSYNHLYIFIMEFDLMFWEEAVGTFNDYTPVDLDLQVNKDIV